MLLYRGVVAQSPFICWHNEMRCIDVETREITDLWVYIIFRLLYIVKAPLGSRSARLSQTLSKHLTQTHTHTHILLLLLLVHVALVASCVDSFADFAFVAFSNSFRSTCLFMNYAQAHTHTHTHTERYTYIHMYVLVDNRPAQQPPPFFAFPILVYFVSVLKQVHMLIPIYRYIHACCCCYWRLAGRQTGELAHTHTHTHTHANKPSLFTLERFNGYVSHLIQFIWRRCQGTVGMHI